jgi:hypothetical protein
MSKKQGPGLGETLLIILAKIVMLFYCTKNYIFIQPSNLLIFE